MLSRIESNSENSGCHATVGDISSMFADIGMDIEENPRYAENVSLEAYCDNLSKDPKYLAELLRKHLEQCK